MTFLFDQLFLSYAINYYNLAKCLTELLDPVNSKQQCAKDSFFVCEKTPQISSNDISLVHYDVRSFFTSITLQKTIQIAVKHIFENNPELKVMKCELKQFFNLAASGIYFIFNSSFYDQINGVCFMPCPCQFVHGLSRKDMVARVWK